MSQGASNSIALGDLEVTRVNDSLHWWDAGAVFGVVPKTLWSRKVQADDLNRVPLAFNSYLVDTAGRRILIETGLGDKRDSRARAYMNVPSETESLPETLRRQGIDPGSIDIVINSHLHWDHASGNTILKEGRYIAAFPQARYFAPRGDWEHAHERHPRDAVSYIDEGYDPLVYTGQMTLVDGDYEVVPGVWMRRAPGHNRDVTVITARNGGPEFCFLSDAVPTAAHVHPTWIAAFDLDPIQSIDTKIKWLGAAADEGWCCAFGHETKLAFARIVRDPKTRFAAEPFA